MQLLKFAIQIIIGLIVLLILCLIIVNYAGILGPGTFSLLLLLFLGYLLITYKVLSNSRNILIRHSIAFFAVLITFFCLLFMHRLAMRYFFDYFIFINRESVDQSIPTNDVRSIYETVRTITNRELHSIELYHCDDETSPKAQIIDGPRKKSKLCQTGDVLVTVGEISNAGMPLGSETQLHFYLLRRFNNKWILIEDLDEGGWIS